MCSGRRDSAVTEQILVVPRGVSGSPSAGGAGDWGSPVLPPRAGGSGPPWGLLQPLPPDPRGSQRGAKRPPAMGMASPVPHSPWGAALPHGVARARHLRCRCPRGSPRPGSRAAAAGIRSCSPGCGGRPVPLLFHPKQSPGEPPPPSSQPGAASSSPRSGPKGRGQGRHSPWELLIHSRAPGGLWEAAGSRRGLGLSHSPSRALGIRWELAGAQQHPPGAGSWHAPAGKAGSPGSARPLRHHHPWLSPSSDPAVTGA